jgi:hypothetical protein
MNDQSIYKDVMVDIETMGTGTDACIIAIGAINFDIDTGRKGEEYYCNVDLDSCISAGLSMDGDTVSWWLMQPKDTIERIFRNQRSIHHALFQFSHYLARFGPDVRMWGNGAGFDLPILRNAYRAIGSQHPWKYRHERDVRTLASLKPEVKKGMVFKGLRHHPLADCRYQIDYCCETYRQLNLKG